MDTVDRRTILATGALALAGAVQSRPAAAQAGPKPMFPVAAITIPIVGETDVFQVRRIYCVGRNYAAHAREMGDTSREPPFFFAKPSDAVVPSGSTIPYPSNTSDLHHEIELVVAIGSTCLRVPRLGRTMPAAIQASTSRNSSSTSCDCSTLRSTWPWA